MNYLVFEDLLTANAFIASAEARIKAILPREFDQYSVAHSHPANGQYAALVNDEFDLVATIEELALKKTRIEVEALGWFPAVEE